MSMSNEYIIDRIDEATRFTRDYKQVCNDALCLARGRLASLQNSVEAKDKRIEELEAEVRDLKAREMAEGNSVIVQDSSGNITIKCSSGSDEDRWIPCSERMPGVFQDVFMKIRDINFQERYITPRIGYINTIIDEWKIYGLPGNMMNLPINYEVIAWRPVPEDYLWDEEEEPDESPTQLKRGYYVNCIGRNGKGYLKAIYFGEELDYWWVLCERDECPQKLSKSNWTLTMTGEYADLFRCVRED